MEINYKKELVYLRNLFQGEAIMKKIISFSLIITILLFTLEIGTISVFAAPTSITPGAIWNDTTGGVIEAHGGGILKVGSTYYWYGEDHTNGYFIWYRNGQ